MERAAFDRSRARRYANGEGLRTTEMESVVIERACVAIPTVCRAPAGVQYEAASHGA